MGCRADAFRWSISFPTLASTSAYLQAGFRNRRTPGEGPCPATVADGSQSFLGGGLHHEFRAFRMLGGHAAFVPYVEYDAIFSGPSSAIG